MKETEGGLREGRVLHVHQSLYAFLHNRGLLESGGVFVTRAMSLTSVVPRLRPHPLLVGRRHKKIPPTPDFYAGGASPAKTPSTWEYSNTPAASPYAGATPAWNPSSRTPVGSPCATPARNLSSRTAAESPRPGGETLASLPHSRSDHFVFRGGETPTWASRGRETSTWASNELSEDEGQVLEMNLSDDTSDVYSKLSSFLISTR